MGEVIPSNLTPTRLILEGPGLPWGICPDDITPEGSGLDQLRLKITAVRE